MLSPIGRGIIGALQSGGAGETRSYSQILIDDYSADEVWPLVDISTGTVIHAAVNEDRNGTLSGWDLQDTAGPVSDTLAPLNGGGDHGSIYSESLNTLFDEEEGSFFLWTRAQNSGVWTNGNNIFILSLRGEISGPSNTLYIAKIDPSTIRFRHRYGANTKDIEHSFSDSGWFSLGMSWSTSSDEFKAYVNGAQVGSTLSSLGTWAGGNLESTGVVLGAVLTSSASPWEGWLAYAAIRAGSVWTPADFANMHDAAADAGSEPP